MKLKFKTELELERYTKLHHSLVRIELDYEDRDRREISYGLLEYYCYPATNLDRNNGDLGYKLITFDKASKESHKFSLRSIQGEKTLNTLYFDDKYSYYSYGMHCQISLFLI